MACCAQFRLSSDDTEGLSMSGRVVATAVEYVPKIGGMNVTFGSMMPDTSSNESG